MGEQFQSEQRLNETLTQSEIFEQQYPFYLSLGMSSAEYWEGDASLVRYYRKAYILKQEDENHMAWLQGLYFYDALSVALNNSFGGKKAKKLNYPSKPYNFNREENKQPTKREIKKEREKGAEWMRNFVNSYTKK